MISKEIRAFLDAYTSDICLRSDELAIKPDLTAEEKVFGHLACLIEEVWELSAELRNKYQMSFNQRKVDAFTEADLEDELVDVLITWLILAKWTWIDSLDKAIERKIGKNNARGY